MKEIKALKALLPSGTEVGTPTLTPALPDSDKVVVLVITFERANHLKRSVDTILKYVGCLGSHVLRYLPSDKKMEIIISQDGSHPEVAAVASSYEREHENIFFLQVRLLGFLS